MRAGPRFERPLQRFLVYPRTTLAADPLFGAPVLAGVLLAFALDLDTRAVDQRVQRLWEPR